MTANDCISVAHIRHCCNRFGSKRRMHENEGRNCNIVKDFVKETKPHLLEEDTHVQYTQNESIRLR